MAGWTYEEFFEDFTTGSINGQDGWTVSGSSPQVINTLSDTGSQSLEFDVSVGNVNGFKNITAVTDDGSIFYYSVRADTASTNRAVEFLLRGSGSPITRTGLRDIGSDGDLDIYAYNTSSYVGVQLNASADTWYRIGTELDFTNNRYRVNVNDGTWSSWYGFQNSTSQVDAIWLLGAGTASVKFYIDDISPDYSTATSNIKSIAGVAKASIKSMAGVTDANNKSVAGVSNV